MPTKIRLQRHGRKGYAFYHIVIADSRAPRDGKFIERIGSYNPNTNPATIDLKFDRALYWLQVGAQPTDTTKNILSSQGVLLKKHLLGGVKKGAFTEAEAETKFQAWLETKQKSVKAEVSKIGEKERAVAKEKLDAEKATNKAKAEVLATKKAALAVAAAKAAAAETAIDAVEAVEEQVVIEVETPVAEAEIPAVEPEAPIAEVEIPAVEPETPVVEAEIPVAEPEAPIVEAEIPAVEPEASVAEEQETPVAE